MKPPLRIAVLECDEPQGRTKEKYGGYGNLFKELLEAGAEKLAAADSGTMPPELDVTKYNVVNEELYPKLENVDAVLLTGSKYNSFDNDEWILKLVDFTKMVLAQDRVRLIGVCFGHQIIGRAMDVGVGRNERGWEVAVEEVRLTGKGRELFGLEDLRIHQMHRDIVYSHPPSVEALGHTDRCDVQGMYERNRLISVQGHPEFGNEIVAEIVQRRYDQGVFDDAMYEQAMERVGKSHDGVVVSAAFLKFLLED